MLGTLDIYTINREKMASSRTLKEKKKLFMQNTKDLGFWRFEEAKKQNLLVSFMNDCCCCTGKQQESSYSGRFISARRYFHIKGRTKSRKKSPLFISFSFQTASFQLTLNLV